MKTVLTIALALFASLAARASENFSVHIPYVTRQVTGNRTTIDIARGIANLVIASHCTGAINLPLSASRRDASH